MSTYKERENILKYGYGEKPQLLALNLEVKDEIVPDSIYFSGQQENYYIMQNKKVIKKLNCIKLSHSAFTECRR